jgi:thioredoxin reductase
MNPSTHFDVIIIGGSYAGLSAAVASGTIAVIMLNKELIDERF